MNCSTSSSVLEFFTKSILNKHQSELDQNISKCQFVPTFCIAVSVSRGPLFCRSYDYDIVKSTELEEKVFNKITRNLQPRSLLLALLLPLQFQIASLYRQEDIVQLRDERETQDTAMEETEFQRFVTPLKEALEGYRREQKGKKEASERKKDKDKTKLIRKSRTSAGMRTTIKMRSG
ncbi:hypothetical protein MG293_007370 [Ovis ammon polii]|uniref:Uncharacterized protein n=1 Tax=Ovis ammon polii TaxID=230172 RepID=A0AAD4YD23_OVIAM|nr:hypothetical protein MG293_007370 [Ovis ammon polii]